MYQNAYDAYLEERILAADPLELVRLLYRGAIEAVRDARHHLAGGRIAERSQALTRAGAILFELQGALDLEKGGEIASRLASLYDYMQRKLWTANYEQSDPPLGEVLDLLVTLSEAWAAVSNTQQPPTSERPTSERPWSQPASQEMAASYAPGGWSL